MRPDPTPEPTKTRTTSEIPLAAPKRFSPHAATERSFAIRTGTPTAARSISPKATSRQPRFGAFTTTPVDRKRHTSELQSRRDLVCRLLLEKKKKKKISLLVQKKKKNKNKKKQT